MLFRSLQKRLGDLYRNDCKNLEPARSDILEMGFAIKRLLEKRELSPFDNDKKSMDKIFNEMNWNKLIKEVDKYGD